MVVYCIWYICISVIKSSLWDLKSNSETLLRNCLICDTFVKLICETVRYKVTIIKNKVAVMRYKVTTGRSNVAIISSKVRISFYKAKTGFHKLSNFEGCALWRSHLSAYVIKDVSFQKNIHHNIDYYSLWCVNYCNFFLTLKCNGYLTASVMYAANKCDFRRAQPSN